MDLWHETTTRQVEGLLSADEAVKGLVIIGSCARSDVALDPWSDIDLAVVVDDQAVERFYPATEWIARFGEPYCFSLNSAGHFGVLRAQFVDGRRLDFVIIAESALEKIDEWERNPLRYENRLLFSRSPMLDRVLGRQSPPPVFTPLTQQQFERMANDFRFKGMLAVSKAARNELLVAVHLGLDMVRDCLVLGMALRDRQTRSDHHRDGSEGNHFLEPLEKTRQSYTALGILDSIEQSAIVFDKLAAQWQDGYHECCGPLLEYVERARGAIKKSGV